MLCYLFAPCLKLKGGLYAMLSTQITVDLAIQGVLTHLYEIGS